MEYAPYHNINVSFAKFVFHISLYLEWNVKNFFKN